MHRIHQCFAYRKINIRHVAIGRHGPCDDTDESSAHFLVQLLTGLMEVIQLGENSRETNWSWSKSQSKEKYTQLFFRKAFPNSTPKTRCSVSTNSRCTYFTAQQHTQVMWPCDFSFWPRDMTGRDEHLLIKGTIFLLHTCDLE